MGKIRAFMTGLLMSGLVLGIGVFSASAATDTVAGSKGLDELGVTPQYIPMEANMSPRHVSARGSYVEVSKRLSWGDGPSTAYFLTYMNGYGAYEYQGTRMTSFSVTAPKVRYTRLSSRTEQTWNDFLSVRGNATTTVAMSGSIKVTR